MIFMFPELGERLKNHIFTYDDKYKIWLKQQLSNIIYIKYLPEKVKDELSIIIKQEFYEENYEIIKQAEVSNKIFILVQGKIEIYVNINDEEIILDMLEEPGCILNQVCILNKYPSTYSARAKSDLEVLSITREDLMMYK